MPTYLNPTQGAVFVQPGGFGQLYKRLPAETNVNGLSGGGFSSESDFTGAGVYVGSRRTSDDERWSTTVETRLGASKLLRQLGYRRPKCYFNSMILWGCAPQDISSFQEGLLLIDIGIASNGQSAPIVKGMEQNDEKVLDTTDWDIAIVEEIYPVAHTRIGLTVTTGGVNAIIPLGILNCAGLCGADNDGNREFIAVGDPVSPATIPRIFYTDDAGVTWVSNALAGIADGAAVSVAVYMNNVLVAVTGTNAGLFRLPLDSIKTAGTLAPVLVTGIAAATAVNKVFTMDNLVYAAGDGGDMWVSVDGGYSFEAITTTLTEDFTTIASADEDLIWFGGTTQALVRVKATYLAETIVVTGLTGDITTVAVPFGRPNAVYVGTSTGEIWRSLNADDPTPQWEELGFDAPVSSIIEDIQFSGALGAVMWVVQSNGSSQSRVIRDLSGGAMGAYALAIGTFTSPGNSLLNAIAPTGVNFALTVGEPNGGQGFIGRINS
jgi:hypothetical protein